MDAVIIWGVMGIILIWCIFIGVELGHIAVNGVSMFEWIKTVVAIGMAGVVWKIFIADPILRQ